MADPMMPQTVRTWMSQRGWGRHHLEWHVVRIWDRVSPSTRQWATQQGWSRYPVQEGQAGNGMEFLAMHRVMIRSLLDEFPPHSALFAGWPSPPADPNDPANPLPNGAQTPFDPDMADAVNRLHAQPTSFASDDEIGVYVETSSRPTAADPLARSSDESAGIHNYLHGRWQDASSPVDMGDPEVNIGNEIFWRLHGWIDARWTAYRQAAGLSENDPAYQQALTDAAHHAGLHGGHPHPTEAAALGAHAEAGREAVPASVREDVRRTLLDRPARPAGSA